MIHVLVSLVNIEIDITIVYPGAASEGVQFNTNDNVNIAMEEPIFCCSVNLNNYFCNIYDTTVALFSYLTSTRCTRL